MGARHVLLLTLPLQGQINPSLGFAKMLVARGIKVTFASTVSARRLVAKATGGDTPSDLTYASFSDGHDDGVNLSDDHQKYMRELRKRSSKAMKDIIVDAAEQGFPVTCLIYTILLPWASEVAREHSIPSALLWIQAATVLNMYYYYFNGFADHLINCSRKTQLPGIGFSLSKRDLPSFFDPARSNDESIILQIFKEHLETLDYETKPKVLVNTFDALEASALKAIDKYELIGIGPLIPSALLGGTDHSEKSFDECGEWLNSKKESSVVYVSFGSLLKLQKEQMEEIARGLQDSGRPFLWVIRETSDDFTQSFVEGLDQEMGKIVEWCSQFDMLAHPSLGCFVTHCGWNSTLESMACGVPVVGFPQWTDQGTNAKLIEDVWRSGVRVRANEDGLVERGEVRRCIEEVMDGGEKSRELKESVAKWKALASEATEENGSSNKNLNAFLEGFGAV